MRLAPVVLPVMRVLTLITHVALHFVVKGAPNRLKMEHVEVCVLFHTVQQVDRKLVLVVCKRAKVAKVAGVDIVRPFVAEFSLVLLRVVERLDSVVCLGARIAIWASPCLSILAHFGGVGT